jgi:hypothetical protein
MKTMAARVLLEKMSLVVSFKGLDDKTVKTASGIE